MVGRLFKQEFIRAVAISALISGAGFLGLKLVERLANWLVRHGADVRAERIVQRVAQTDAGFSLTLSGGESLAAAGRPSKTSIAFSSSSTRCSEC